MEDVTLQDVEKIVSVLTDEQKQLLKDVIRYGEWGDSTELFLDEKGADEEAVMMAYCTNDAKKAGNFTGRKISGLFRGIYHKLCPAFEHKLGRYISHCSDWWGDGSGDMLFIRATHVPAFEVWARL